MTKHTFTLFLACLLAAVAMQAQESRQLSGTPIGSANVDYATGRPSTTVNTPACAFDGDLETFYASYDRSRTWVGLDLGTPHVITRLGWCPRKGQPVRVQLGVFEGSNSPDFLDAVPLFLIPKPGQDLTMEYADVPVTRGFRYVRYVGPSDARCNIGELAFYGYEGEGTDDRFYQVSGLPTVSIHTYAGYDPQDKVTEMESNITITYDGGTRIQEAPITARGRGNASWSFPKKPYRIKFTDKSRHMLKGSAQESPAKAKKWTLINNYGDKTLMRNCLAFEVSRRLNSTYTPYCQPVDVIMNGEYKGCYQLCDQISVDPNRVPVTEMEPWENEEPELTGGYLVEVDAYAHQETSWFNSSRGIPVTIKSPGDDEITTEQSRYIKNHFNLMESAAWSSSYTDPEKGYRKYLDAECFLKHFLTGEFSGNTDVYWSTYMYKDREEDQFHVAPSWDFDLAFDNDSRIYPVNNRSDWVYRSGGSSAGNMTSLVSRLLSDPALDKQLRQMWKDSRKVGIMDEKSLVAYVDSMAEAMDASQRLNFIRWPILNQKVHMNVSARGSFEEEVNVLRNYIPARLQWIDEHLGISSGIEYNDSTFYISTPEQLVEFAEYVSKGATYSNAYLEADLDMAACNDRFQPVGTERRPFRGTFDGQGHRISNLVVKGNNFAGLIGTVSGGAVIRDLVLDGSCLINGNNYVGLIGGSVGSGLVTVSRVGNEADVNATGCNAAGIIGCNYGSTANFHISDCYNTGHIKGNLESATISGWVGTSSEIHDCWNIGTVEGFNYRNDFYRGGASVSNCWSTSGAQVTRMTDDVVQRGELCYNLNAGNTVSPTWYQTLGQDAHPVFDASHAVVLKAPDGTYYNNVYVTGDVNDDHALTGTDAEWMAAYLDDRMPEGFNVINADVNNDGVVDVADYVAIRLLVDGKQLGDSPLTARLYASDASVKAAAGRKVTVWIASDRPATAYSLRIRLSDGLSIGEGTLALGTAGKSPAHHVTVIPQPDGALVRVFAQDLSNLNALTGTAMTFSVRADEQFTGGTLTLCDQRIVTADGVAAHPDDAQYEVALAPTAVASIMLEPDDLELIAGQEASVVATVLPVTATVKSLLWISSDDRVATVTDGLVRAVSAGDITITATATDGSRQQASLRVTVYDDADGLDSPHTDGDEGPVEIYDLSGHRIDRIRKSGIYIINGKKSLVSLREK